MLQTATPEQTTAILAKQQAALVEGQDELTNALDPASLISGLSAFIRNAFELSVRVKNNSLTLRLLDCQRQRRGQYSPMEMSQIAEQGGSDIFINLTNIKCRAAESWIKDVMFQNGDKPWTLDPTEIPTLPVDIDNQLVQIVKQEQMQAASDGAEIHPEAAAERLDELRDELLEKLTDIAADRASNMERMIEDQMEEGGWDKALSQFINDYTTFPVAVIKGPVAKQRIRVNYDNGGNPVVEKTIVYEFERVSPFDIYPAPDAYDIHDGPLIQRHRLHAKAVFDMKGVPGYKDSAIEQVLEKYGDKGFVSIRAFDNNRDALESRPITGVWGRTTIEALQFWGPVAGKHLKDWAGVDADRLGMANLDDNTPYEVEAWMIGEFVIKAVLNPDRFGLRPYFKASWDEVPGSWWGVAVGEIMGDIQRMINACARALANNMGIASGPQVEINVDRLADGITDVESLYPWKIWQTKSDKTGSGHNAVTFFQPDSHAQELMEVMDWHYKKADEVTGIPNYTYGSAQVGGAGRTASGLSMLMDNASKGIKQAISNIDTAISQIVMRMYMHNMMESSDPSIKGDCRVVAKGTLGLIQKEAIQSRRTEFLQATSNPVDLQIMGPEGRAYLLRDMAKGLQLDVDKIIPSPQKLQQIQAQQQQAQQAQQEAMQQAQQPQPESTMQLERGPDGSVQRIHVMPGQPPQGGPPGPPSGPAGPSFAAPVSAPAPGPGMLPPPR